MVEKREAIVSWVNSLVQTKISSITELSDGNAISHILTGMDNKWFKQSQLQNSHSESTVGWVFKFNNLKKLYKLILSYYEEELNLPTSNLIAPNLNAIAKENDEQEIIKFVDIILALVVQCKNNQPFITKIQELESAYQQVLMVAIEQTIQRLNSTSSPVDGKRLSNPDINGKSPQILELEKQNKILKEQIENFKSNTYELSNENKDLKFKLSELENTVNSKSETGQIDFLLKNEISNLKSDLQKSQDKLLESQLLAEKQSSTIVELTKKSEEDHLKALEAVKLKDQLDEFRHLADKLQKSEALIEKYKKKIEDNFDLKKKFKILEDENSMLNSRQFEMENEFKKLNSYKPLMETYKDQIKTLEEKTNVLQVQVSKSDFEIRENKIKVERLEQEKRAAIELSSTLEDRLREIELGGDIGQPNMSLDGELAGDFTSSDSLRQKIVQLERQLEKFKGSNPEDNLEQRIILLENLLEDSNRMKSKFEDDYLSLYQKNLQLENEIKQNASGPQSLQLKLVEKEQIINDLYRKLDKGQEVKENSLETMKLRQQVEELLQKERISEAKLNKLAGEKEQLVENAIELKERVSVEEKKNSDLRAMLAAVESEEAVDGEKRNSKLVEATQKLVQLKQQNEGLHNALKQAKDRILSFEKSIKELKSQPNKENFNEAKISYEALLKEKDLEIQKLILEVKDVRNSCSKESRLISSAFHQLGMKIQQKEIYGISLNGSGTLSGEGSSKNASSWLKSQRKELDNHLKRK
ncbi:hypothetical protein HK099_004356 [Clydaea vesicula]|uniref:Uncharacterized protein n=1 Tax=Clydaea vesicula TaxID=447962 RepID=A0AAD5XVP1_9FUNG|nr:hypothetical protein HK099_004356 [Clydaea vesicula]